MRWLSDAQRGEWLRPLIDASWAGPPSMHAVVPRGLEAYARIFHPVGADRPIGGDWRAHEMGEVWGGEVERHLANWSDVAAFTGTTPHPLMQWHAIAHRPLYRTGELYDALGWRHSEPATGNLDPGVLADVAAVLAAHTTTPDAGVAAIWDGWGGPRLGDMAAAASFELPGREYKLLEVGIAAFARESWPSEAPWIVHDWAPQSPSIIWPDDHAWALVTEIDFDSTVVAGSRALIEALLRHPKLEARELAEGADLSWTGDLINPAAPGQPDFTEPGTTSGAPAES